MLVETPLETSLQDRPKSKETARLQAKDSLLCGGYFMNRCKATVESSVPTLAWRLLGAASPVEMGRLAAISPRQ